MFNFRKWADTNRHVAAAVTGLMQRWGGTYEKKNANYGTAWLLTGETMSLWFPKGITVDTPRKFIMLGLTIRMLDKIIRAANLELAGEEDKVGEKSLESYGDLGVYGFMAAAAASNEQAFSGNGADDSADVPARYVAH